uniref:Uncharacterized protein n=1 Tax=Arundo donax TaxID=35708 RepID=A0A0A8ZDI0_ARUDO
MECVTTVRYAVCFNGVLLKHLPTNPRFAPR